MGEEGMQGCRKGEIWATGRQGEGDGAGVCL